MTLRGFGPSEPPRRPISLPYRGRRLWSETIMAMTTRATPQRAAEGAATRERPYVVRLEARPGTVESGRPPVRIFLGTQDEQWRAGRSLFYSIERLRDPARVYATRGMEVL